MKRKTFKFPVAIALIASAFLAACKADSNSPGLEYMPDMYRSPAVEAYVDYAEVEGVKDEEAQELIEEKFSFKPPVGTIPYTAEGDMYLAPYSHPAPFNIGKTHGLFEANTDSVGKSFDVIRAETKSHVNPIDWSEDAVSEGKELYERFCIHCHGEEGDGQGSVITGSGGKYPTPGPYKSELEPGEVFYTITYGKNAMGSHASQVNPVERWKIVHYVMKLIGKEQKPELVEAPAVDSTGAEIIEEAVEMIEAEVHETPTH